MKDEFTEEDIEDMSHTEFQLAIIGLIDKGLMEMEERNGIRYYRPTLLLKSMEDHFYSDASVKN